MKTVTLLTFCLLAVGACSGSANDPAYNHVYDRSAQTYPAAFPLPAPNLDD